MNYHSSKTLARHVIDQDYAMNYRQSDEREIQTENHEYFCKILRQLTVELAPDSRALDLGCGTGRYFHCLQNVSRLTGIDLSFNMLRQALIPVKRESISVRQIDLVCANIADIPLRLQFDFIFSVGVFGEHTPWDVATCNKLFDSLKPGGRLFFTVVDVFSKYPVMTRKRQVAETFNLILPPQLKQKLRQRLGTFYVTRRELVSIFKKAKFQKYEIHKHVSSARLWKGAHYTCIAAKLL